MSDIQIGDKVQLRSGPPQMVVEKRVGTRVFCVWYENGIIKREWFDIATLEKVRPLNPGTSR